MATTTNYGWTTPDDTGLVKDGASAIRSLGTAIDTTVYSNANAAIAKTLIDAKGDLIVGSAADTAARLAVGTNGQYLKANSSATNGVEWADISAGGMTLLTSGALSGSSVSLSSISSSYKNLRLIIRNFKPNADGARLYLRFNSDSSGNYQTPGLTSSTNIAFGDTYIIASQVTDNSVSEGICVYDIPDYANSTTWKIVQMLSILNNDTTTTNFQLWHSIGVYNQTSAISTINLLPNTSTFTSGNYYLYGVA